MVSYILMEILTPDDFAVFYTHFQSPIAALDCGKKCAPYNEYGIPFCCDARHAIPTAFLPEWGYLHTHTDLWHLWQVDNLTETARLQLQTPSNQVLIECLGYKLCQREYRSLACRAFPFYPYITRQGEFIGLSYFWEYEERCWIISNLNMVTASYREEFMKVYSALLFWVPQELESARYHSTIMRRVFGRKGRTIPLLHRNGNTYKVAPRTGRMRRVCVASLPKYGSYKIAAELSFADEAQNSMAHTQV
jgi:hypothetical protein